MAQIHGSCAQQFLTDPLTYDNVEGRQRPRLTLRSAIDDAVCADTSLSGNVLMDEAKTYPL